MSARELASSLLDLEAVVLACLTILQVPICNLRSAHIWALHLRSMYFSKLPSSARERLTRAQLEVPVPSKARVRPTKMAGRKAHRHPARPLPYYEDYYGRVNSEEDCRADYCGSESDEEKETKSDRKRKRPSNEDNKDYIQPGFDFRGYGKRAGPVGLSDEETDDMLSERRTSANLHGIEARFQRATGFGQFPDHQSDPHLFKPHVNNRERRNNDPGQATVYEQKDAPGDLLLSYDKAQSTKGQTSLGSACPTCGAVVVKAKQCTERAELDLLASTFDSRLLAPLEMARHSTKQAPRLGSVKTVTDSGRTKNSQVGHKEDDFGDDLRDINQDYHLLETSVEMPEESKEVPAIPKVDIKQQRKAKKDDVAGNTREGTVHGQARYSTRGAELAAQREEEEQRLARRRVTRRIAATASSVPTSQLKKKKEYGRGSMTARSAVLSRGTKSRKKRERSLPALKAKVGKQCLRNWGGEELILQPGQMIPIVDIGGAQ